MNTDPNTALLPSGFSDLLPPEAGKEADAISVLLDTFKKFGYRRIKPPMAEFEDSLLAPGPGAALADNTFRVMDPVSHRMMGIRSDITPQIARIAMTRLSDEQRPIRLTYANDVLRTRGSQQRTSRQFTQVGCEIVGSDDAHTDLEICMLALSGLSALNIKGITLDLNLPHFVRGILKQCNVSDDEQIKALINNRDLTAIRALKGEISDLLASVLEVFGDADKTINILQNINCDDVLNAQIQQLSSVYAQLKTAIIDAGLNGISLSVDVLETKGLEYHSGVSFSLYAKDASAPLGRGGRYEISAGNTNETATGFTLYMDTLCGVMPLKAKTDKIFVSADESWGVIYELQEQGWIIIRQTGHNNVPAECTHKYASGKIEKIK